MGYLRDRMIQAGVTFYGIVTVTYILNKLMPGGPVDYLWQQMQENPSRWGLPPEPTSEQIEQQVQLFLGGVSPEQGVIEGYISYLQRVFLEFDLGQTIVVQRGSEVEVLLLQRAPWTIFISTIGLIYGLVIGITLGAMMAYYEGTKFDVGMTVSMILNGAIPYYAAAIFLIYFLGFQMGVFPTSGRYTPGTEAGINWPWISGVLEHAAMPALSIIIVGFGGGALGLRANAIRLLGSDSLRVAELRGLSSTRIASAYLARNAILPMYTSIIIGLGGIIGGSVILEQIFNYPGMGLLLFQAIESKDMALLMGGVTITSLIFIVGTLLADFTYSIVDPRTDLRGMEE